MSRSLFRVPMSILLCVGVSACAQMQAAKQARLDAMFQGLNRMSYGPLNPALHPDGDLAYVTCNGGTVADRKKSVEGTNKLASWLGVDADNPLGMATDGPVDGPLIEAGLSTSFKHIRFVDAPPVRLISTANNAVDFWFLAREVGIDETDGAAAKYCGEKKLKATYDGASMFCFRNAPGGMMPRPAETFVIAGYHCGDGRASPLPFATLPHPPHPFPPLPPGAIHGALLGAMMGAGYNAGNRTPANTSPGFPNP